MTINVTLAPVGSLIDATTAQTAINNNSTAIVTGFETALDTSGDQMEGNLDMNNNRVLNLPSPVTSQEPLRLTDLNSFVGGGTVTNIPAGGTIHQVLAKTSNTDYAVGWSSESANVIGGSNISVTGGSPVTVALVTSPSLATITNTGTLTLPTSTDTLVGRATTDILTNKTLTSPTLTAPILGTPSSGTLSSCTGYPTANLTGLGTGVATFLATPTSANLKTAVATSNTGSGALVFGISPSLTTPNFSSIVNTGTLTLPTASDTLIGRATTDSLTNKTFDTAATGNSLLISSVGVARGQYPGTATNDNATAANIGEYIESVVASGAPVSITSNTAKDLTTISLTAGDWDVDGVMQYLSVTGTSVTALGISLSLTANTLDASAGRFVNQMAAAFVPGNGATSSVAIPPLRFSLSATTTIHLVGLSTFTVSTLSMYGIIRARRIR